LIQIVPGLLLAAPMFVVKYEWIVEGRSLFIVFINCKFKENYFLAAYAINTTYILILIASHIVSVTILLKLRAHQGPRQTTAWALRNRYRRKMEDRRLFAHSFAVCAIDFTYFLFVIWGFIDTDMSTSTFFFYYNTMNNIYCCSTPYMAIIFSEHIREHCKILLGYDIRALLHNLLACLFSISWIRAVFRFSPTT
uniref:G protein-coupled receptor n=1 Tax=Gongylonema pulchrum TaxID=637853 RepID=A0A183DTN2_9BILA